MWGVFFGRRFLSRGFFPLPIGQKEEWDANSNRTHNTLLRSSEEHEKRTLSVLQTKAFRNNKARRPKRKRRGRPKAKSYIMAFYRKTQRRIRDKKKTFYIICLGFVNVAFLCVSIYVSPSGLHSFRVPPPFFDPDESIKQTPEDFIEWSGEGDVHLGFSFCGVLWTLLFGVFIHSHTERTRCVYTHTHIYIYIYTHIRAFRETEEEGAFCVSLASLSSLLLFVLCIDTRSAHFQSRFAFRLTREFETTTNTSSSLMTTI